MGSWTCPNPSHAQWVSFRDLSNIDPPSLIVKKAWSSIDFSNFAKWTPKEEPGGTWARAPLNNSAAPPPPLDPPPNLKGALAVALGALLAVCANGAGDHVLWEGPLVWGT